ncbi:MAG: hypothetical protein COW59_01035 [Lysobacterales bacterium CG17_big_fil_post_rev_8_21_14_2_50_64_11]|nr:MAG: hypothetical protein COW59_01035 [Xanthomonadales bacterium CG17_big_fil_post_rev_8_21_14_2_50_64_11]PIX61228.1 MAG: hypothetical protein COZ47_03010 [Xanthomonadales bacterium CG_4_10_14_3_um_filter_64_11]
MQVKQTKLQLSLAVSLALASGPLLALGLGQIEVKSRLSQPLLAEIPIASSNPGELDSLSVALASPEAFARVGLDRPLFLAANLEFSVGRNERGENVIRVSTSKPVDDPFVSFLLEADWGSGKLVREFSVLLDPPYLAPSPRAPVSPARVVAAPATVARPVPAPLPNAPVPPAVPTVTAVSLPASGSPQVSNGQFGPVVSGQTLSQIANRLRPAGVGLNQMMVALLRANASAFIDGNIHQLKRGAILRIPGSDELAVLSAADAAAIVREQTEAWQNAREPQLQPIDSRSATAAAPARATPAADGRLSIVPPSGAQARASQSGASAAGEGAELRAQLSEAHENLAARDGEIKELRSRVTDLEKLRDSNTKLVALKDSELADLQQRLRELEQARKADAERAASAASADTGAVAADTDAPDTAAAPSQTTAAPSAAVTRPATVAGEKPPAPTPPPAAAPATPWYMQTMTLAGIAVLVVGLLSLLLLRRKPKVTSGVGAARKRGSDAGSLAASIDALRASPQAETAEASESPAGFDEDHLRELRANAVMRPEQLEAHLALLRFLHANDMAEAFADAATDMLPHVLDPNGPQWREACAMGDSLMPGNALFAIAPAQAADDGADGDALGDAPSAPAAAQAQSSAASDEDFERALADLDATLPLPESSATSAWDDGDAAASAANAQDLVSPAAHEASLQAAAAPDTAGSGTLYDADDGLADGTDDASETKLDLAQAYIDIGDNEAAHALLDEVLTEGNAAQRLRAERLLADLR